MTKAATDLAKKQQVLHDKQRALHEAEEYVSKIGLPESHFTPVSHGRLNKVEVHTEIAYQRSSGAQNYHCCPAFDTVLTEVIAAQFDSLAAMAIQTMRTRYEAALRDQHAELVAALAEVHTLNVKGGIAMVGLVPCQSLAQKAESFTATPRHHRENAPLYIYKYSDKSHVEQWHDHDQGWDRLRELNRDCDFDRPEYYVQMSAGAPIYTDKP